MSCGPAAGTVSVAGVLGYLPQTLPLAGDLTVAEVLGDRPGARRRWTPSSPATPSEEHFTTIGDDWDIEERTRAQLDRLGLGDVAARPGGCAPSAAARSSPSAWRRSC